MPRQVALFDDAAVVTVPWDTPTRRWVEYDASGSRPMRGYTVRFARGSVPFRWFASLAPSSSPSPVVPVARAEGADGQAPSDDRPPEDPYLMDGVASSTSVDWYGTEMSLDALEGMAAQMRAGVPILPRHGNFIDAQEWDAVMGRTVEARVERGTVQRPYRDDDDAARGEPGEGLLLHVRAALRARDPMVRLLRERLDEGDRIGLSIGGWVSEVQLVVRDDDDDVTRIIINEVELDHTAVTRAPANTDSWIDGVRSRLGPAIDARARGTAVARAVTPYQDLPVFDDRAEPWDAAEAEKDVLGDEPGAREWARYRAQHLWWDPDAAETRAGYKLPIAKPDGDALRVPWKALVSAAGALRGARGGVDLSDEDKRRCWSTHIEPYYKKFGEEAPAFEDAAPPAAALTGTPPALDTRAATGHAGIDRGTATDPGAPGAVAIDGARGAPPSPQPTEDTMDPKALQEIIDRALAPVTSKLVELEARVAEATAPAPVAAQPVVTAAPAADARDAEIARLKADLDARDLALRALAEQPVRRGLHGGLDLAAGAPPSTLRSLVDRARAEGSVAVAAVLSDEKRFARLTADGDDNLKVRGEHALDDLKALLRAAEADGLLRPFDMRTGVAWT